MTASKKIQAARVGLLLDQPFFGVLALRLRMVEDPKCDGAWTDGRTLGYNPGFIDKLSHEQCVGLLAHEIMHCAMGHPWRRGAREGERWNQACDQAINHVLKSSGLKLPDDGKCDPQFEGKSAEWAYDRMPAKKKDDKSGKSKGKGNGPGEVRDAPPEAAEDGATEADWEAATKQSAMAAQAQGKLPGNLARFAEERLQPKVDWRAVLHRFIQEVSKSDYSWRMPNVRYVNRGLYLPSLYSRDLGPILVAIDTSGSIDDVLLAQFRGELQSVIDEANPARVHIVYCDAKVNRHDILERGDVLEMHPCGGGGTAFAPVFELAADLDEQPVAIVYLTDLEGPFGFPEPGVPTLWATTGRHTAPFGETVRIE